MSRSKRILCALLACMLALPAVFAEEPAPEPTAAPAAEATAEPTAEPTVEATEEPTEEPTAEPTVEPTSEPTAEPTAEPTSEPTAEPTSEPTPEPTSEPTAEPTSDPTAEPGPLFEITAAGSAQLVDGVWQISVQTPDEEIALQWTPVEGATVYEVKLLDSLGAELFTAQTAEPALALPASCLGTDACTLTVSAWQEQLPDEDAGAEAAKVLLMQGSAQLALSQGGFGPGGFPGGGRPGGGFGGGRPSGQAAGGGELPQEEQGFRVTPGEALTSSHASGTKDMQLYGTVEVASAEEPMTVLTLDGQQLNISADGQMVSFLAVREEDVLALTPQSETEAWSVSALALKILGRSGISRVRLMLGGEAVELSTQWSLQGAEYARLCAAGYVSKDYTLTVTRAGTTVTVADRTYTIDENNELVGG